MDAAPSDANGNRSYEREDLGGQPIASYDAQDRLTAYAGRTYTWSEAGELESVTEGGQTTSFAHDPLGSLRSVCLGGALPSCSNGTLIAYEIDGLGRRVGKRVNGALQKGFLWSDGLRVVAELDGSGAVVSRFVYGTRPNVPEYVVKGGNTYRILTDHLGSVRLAVDAATGAVAQRIDYDAWGVPTFVTGPADFQPFGFAGGLYDVDTGLVRFGARDYDARTGRWTSKDPIRFLGRASNLYGYAFFDPINLTDPSGLFLVPPHIVFGAVVGAVTGSINSGLTAAAAGASNLDVAQAAFAGALVGGASGAIAAALGPFGSGLGKGAFALAGAVGFAGGFSGNLVGQSFGCARPDLGWAAKAGTLSALAAIAGTFPGVAAAEAEAAAGASVAGAAVGDTNVATLITGIVDTVLNLR